MKRQGGLQLQVQEGKEKGKREKEREREKVTRFESLVIRGNNCNDTGTGDLAEGNSLVKEGRSHNKEDEGGDCAN